MAKSLLFPLLAAALLIGCQQHPAIVDPLLTPNLDGPVVQAPGTPGFSAPGPAPNSEKPRFRPPDVPEAWIPTAPPNAWRWIIIHHSATPAGNAAVFDRTHRRKGWDELAYHFVIGNGTGSGDGQIEVGSRWPKQKWGAHAKTPDNQFNDFGIGICLVGNFDIDRPTSAQLRSLTKLLAYLTKTYHIPPGRLLGHGEIKPTDCPGRNMNIAEVRRTVAALAQAPPGPDVTMAHAPDRRLLKSAPSP